MVCACEGHEFVWSLHAPVIIFERMRSGLPGGSANSRCAVNLASSSRMGHGIPEASRTRLYASSSMRDSIQTPSHGLRSLGGFEGLGIPRSSSTPKLAGVRTKRPRYEKGNVATTAPKHSLRRSEHVAVLHTAAERPILNSRLISRYKN